MDFAQSAQESVSFNFSLEDTTDKSYRDISVELQAKGWNRVGYKKRSKMEKKRLPMRDQPHVIWTLNEKDIDFQELTKEQACNHYEGITSITTKRGFCELLRELHWYSEDANQVSPRCYNLGDPIHRDEFIDDFRLVAAMNILKWYVTHCHHGGKWCRVCGESTVRSVQSANSTAGSSSSARTFGRTNTTTTMSLLPPAPPNGEGGTYSDPVIYRIIQYALSACLWEIRVLQYGEWPEVDISRYFKDRDKALDENQWCEILDVSYDLADMKCDYKLQDLYEAVNLQGYGGCNNDSTLTLSSAAPTITTSSSSKCNSRSNSIVNYGVASSFNPFLFKVKTVLQCMSVVHPQLLNIDGNKNIWVIKAPDSSCGIGIKLHSRLDDILESERGMGGRTVQKYVEFPLLAPIKSSSTQKIDLQNTPLAKFDMRIWVLVTSFQPLQAHIYTQLYGRRCGSEYSADLSTLTDNYAHLTNYSVQKKQKFSATPASEQAENEPGSSTVSAKIDVNSARKLRNVVSNYRARRSQEALDTGSADEVKSGSTKRLRVAESDLLMSHVEIAAIVRRSYAQYQSRDDALARAVVRKIGAVSDVWADYMWPVIKSKIRTTLQAAKDNVVHRPRSFEFLGYDVIIDAALEPWILEVNMSPAMAHRTPEQSLLIETMTKGLLGLAVYPHYPTLFVDDQSGNEHEPARALGYGSWEVLCATDASIVEAECSGVDLLKSDLTVAESDFVPVTEVSSVVLGDWDEIEPPEVTARKARKAASALHRKYSGVGLGGNPQSAASIPGDQVPVDPYFQKFVLAAGGASGQVSNKTVSSAVPEGTASNNSGGSFGNFMAVGVAISERAIDITDKLCVGFQKLRVLQQWWRCLLQRTRLYHSKRTESCLKIQCAFRQHCARKTVVLRRRLHSATTLQCFARRIEAGTKVKHLRTTRAASIIQRHARGAQGRKKFIAYRRAVRGAQICKWILQQVLRRRVKAATLIVLRVRSWVQRRFAAAVVLRRALKVNYVRRWQRALRMKRLFACWYRETRVLVIKRRSSLKALSRVAAQKAQSLQIERVLAQDNLIRLTETALMGSEEQRMHQHIVHENNVGVAEDIVWDVLDEVWAVIRRLRLSQKKMRRAKASSPAKVPIAQQNVHEPPLVAPVPAIEVPAVIEKKKTGGTPIKSKQINLEETVDVAPIAEYLSQQFTKSHHHSLSRHDSENVTGGPPPFNARDEFQFTGDELLQTIIASSNPGLAGDGAFVDTRTVHDGWVDPSQAQHKSTSAHIHNHVNHSAADMIAPVHGYGAGRQRPERPYLDPSSYDYAEGDEHLCPAPSPTWSSNGSQGSRRSRSRVIQRPNVTYDGQNPVVDDAPNGEFHFADNNFASTQPQKFAARPMRPAPSEHFALHDHRRDHRSEHRSEQVPPTEHSAQAAAVNLDAAIEQASFMNMQNILGRKIGRPGTNRDVSGERCPSDANTQVQSAGAPPGPTMYPPAFDFYGQSVHCGSVGGASAVTEESDPLCRYLDTINLDSTAPARRSFDATFSARAQHRQPAVKKQHENKNWFSYDEGTTSAKPPGNNDAWFTFLKQKREQQELNDRSNREQNSSRPVQPDKFERKQRPKSSSGVRSTTPQNENAFRGSAPTPQYATLGGPVYELHHHGAVSAISNGPSSRPQVTTERSRPISASARLHRAATRNTQQPVSPQARPQTNEQAGMTGPSADFPWDCDSNGLQAELKRAPYRDETRSEKQDGQQQRAQQREGKAKSRAARGDRHPPRNKDELIEKLTAAYIGASR